MNILKFVTWLNKTRGWHIEGSYYAAIDEWRAWWRGEYSPFHTVKEAGLDDVIHERPMYRLRMPKRACEDWASLLLNDKTTVTAQNKATADWLLGPEGGQTGGMLGQLAFWQHANELVELAMRSGTGAFVMSLEGLTVQAGQAVASPEGRLWPAPKAGCAWTTCPPSVFCPSPSGTGR